MVQYKFWAMGSVTLTTAGAQEAVSNGEVFSSTAYLGAIHTCN